MASNGDLTPARRVYSEEPSTRPRQVLIHLCVEGTEVRVVWNIEVIFCDQRIVALDGDSPAATAGTKSKKRSLLSGAYNAMMFVPVVKSEIRSKRAKRAS